MEGLNVFLIDKMPARIFIGTRADYDVEENDMNHALTING